MHKVVWKKKMTVILEDVYVDRIFNEKNVLNQGVLTSEFGVPSDLKNGR